MIKLYGFGKNLGLVDASPFVAKVYAFLKINKLPFERINSPKNIGQSPKGKLPFIDDDGDVICDSQDIINHLTRKYNLALDAHLSTQQKATAYLLTKSLDENLYWTLVWSRWQHEATWKIVKKVFFKGIPFPLSAIVPHVLRKKVIKTLKAQGTGRHSEAEIIEIAKKSFAALSDLLGENSYFFGNKVSTFDATAFAFISSFTQANIDNEINKTAKQFKNLVTYANKIKEEFAI
jgi:glutathione S-transferase